MNLIMGSRSDGWGRIRIALIGLFALVTAGGFFAAYILEARNPVRDNVIYMMNCVGAENRPTEYCRERQARLKKFSDKRLDDRAMGTAFFLGASAFLWLITGLMGWIYRGFAEKSEDATS